MLLRLLTKFHYLSRIRRPLAMHKERT
jgi:hypothetical protein